MASSTSKKLANAQAASLAAQVANMAAQLDFQKERMRLLELPQFQHLSQMDIDKLAFEKSQATWENALKEATLTGTYQGQPTLQYLEQQAKLFGVIDGQQTLEGKLSDAQIAQINHSMQLQSHASLLEDQKFGFERERWGKEFDYQMQKDLRDFGVTEAQLTGMYNGQQTLASKELDSKNVQAYLGLLGSLQGPGNAFKQMRVLGSTPQNLQSLVGQWTGQYETPGLTSTGQAPGQANVSDLFNQSYGQQFLGSQPQSGGTPGLPGQPLLPPPPGTVGAAGISTAGPQYGPYQGGAGQVNGPNGIFNYNDARSYSEAVRLAQGLPPLLATGSPISSEGPHYPYNENPALRPGPDANWNVPTNTGVTQVYPIGQAPPSAAQAAATAAQMGVAGMAATDPDRQIGITDPGYVAPDPALRGTGVYSGQTAAPAAVTDATQPGEPLDPRVGATGVQAGAPPPGEQGYTVSPAGTQAPIGAYNYEATPSGQTQVYPPGVAAPADSAQTSTSTPQSMSGNVGLLPSQINAENYENSNEYAKQFLWGYLENSGWDPIAAQSAYQQSLPTYGGPASGTVNAGLGF